MRRTRQSSRRLASTTARAHEVTPTRRTAIEATERDADGGRALRAATPATADDDRRPARAEAARATSAAMPVRADDGSARPGAEQPARARRRRPRRHQLDGSERSMSSRLRRHGGPSTAVAALTADVGRSAARRRRITCYRSLLVKLPTRRAVQHHLSARRPGARPVDRRDHHPDLPDLHLRPGRARQAQGLRVRAHAEPDARRARAQPRGDRRRQGRRSRSPRAWRRSTPIATLLKAGDHVVVSDNIYGGTFRLFDKVLTRYQLSFSYVDTVDLDAVEQAITPGDPDAVRRDADQPAHAAHRSAARPPSSRTGTTSVWSSTTRSRAPTSSGRSSSAPTSSSHSTTKYLNGHSDSVGGVVIAGARRRHRVAEVRPERRRRDPRPVRLVAGAARHQDAAAAHGAAQRQRPGARASSWRRTRRSQQVYYPGLAVASAARAGAAADARLRRDARVRARVARGRARGC